MPINFASQAGQMADIVSQPMNAFMQARSDRDATQARNVMLQQRQQAQQQAQIDAETQRDMQATYARLSAGDPQATRRTTSARLRETRRRRSMPSRRCPPKCAGRWRRLRRNSRSP